MVDADVRLTISLSAERCTAFQEGQIRHSDMQDRSLVSTVAAGRQDLVESRQNSIVCRWCWWVVGMREQMAWKRHLDLK